MFKNLENQITTMENRKDGGMQQQPFGIQFPDRNVADAGMYGMLNALVMTGMTLLAQQNERDYQEKLQAQRQIELEKIHAYELRLKELELMGRPQAIPQGQSVNPYRGANTVAELEKILLGHSPSPQRESVLRELAKYPETMPLAQLPATTTRLLTGK